MNLRKEIPLRNRLEDDDSYVDPVPHGRTNKPKIWRAPKKSSIPFKLQPAAFPSLPLKPSLNTSSKIAQNAPAQTAETELPADPTDVNNSEPVDQSHYASKIDFHNSNNLSQGFPLAVKQTVTWSDLGLATQLMIWTHFHKFTRSRVAAELLGLTVEQQKCIESLQCVSAISGLSETELHEQIRKEYQHETLQYNYPPTHSQIAARFMDDLILEGHLYHPYEYEIERGKKFLSGLGLTKIPQKWEPFTPEQKNGQNNPRKPIHPIKVANSNSSDSGYDSALPSKERHASNPAILSPGRKRPAEEAFSGPVLVQTNSFKQDTPGMLHPHPIFTVHFMLTQEAYLVPPTAVAQAIQSTTQALNQHIAQLEPATKRPERPVAFSLPVDQQSSDPLHSETQSIQSRNTSSGIIPGIESSLRTSTELAATGGPWRNKSRDVRWSSQVRRDLENREETYGWRTGDNGEDEELEYSSESDLSEFDPENTVETPNQRQNPTIPVSVSLSEEGNNIKKRLVIMKIKNGIAVLRKEKIFKPDRNDLSSSGEDGFGASDVFDHAPSPTKNGPFNLEILPAFTQQHAEDMLQPIPRQGQESPLPIENAPIEFWSFDSLRDSGPLLSSHLCSEDEADSEIWKSGKCPTMEFQTKAQPLKPSSNNPAIETGDVSVELDSLPREEEASSGDVSPLMMLVRQLKKNLNNEQRDICGATIKDMEPVHNMRYVDSVSSSASSLSKRLSPFGAEDSFSTNPTDGLSEMESLWQKEQPSSPKTPPFSPLTPSNARSSRRTSEFADAVMSEAGQIDPFQGDSNGIQLASDLIVRDLPLGKPVMPVLQAESIVENSPVPKPLRLKLLMGRRSLDREFSQLGPEDQPCLAYGVPKLPSTSLVNKSSAKISDPLLPTAPQNTALAPPTVQRRKKAKKAKESEKIAPLKKLAKRSTSVLSTSDDSAALAKSRPARQALLALSGEQICPSAITMGKLNTDAAQSPVSIAKIEATQIVDQTFQMAKDKIDNVVQALDSKAGSISAASNTAGLTPLKAVAAATVPSTGGCGIRMNVKVENLGMTQKTQYKEAGRKWWPNKIEKMPEDRWLK